MDCLFVNANCSGIYQHLATDFSAIEPPTWALLLAESCRKLNFSVAILDADALRLSTEETAQEILDAKASIVLFVVYGQNPNSGTTGMAEVERVCQSLSDNSRSTLVGVVGSHASAEPLDVLKLAGIDFVLINEGVYALHNLLRSCPNPDLSKIKGLAHRPAESITGYRINEGERVVPQDRMDIDLPGYAWDLLPFKRRPLDLYRAHFWHADFAEDRSPFVSIYTSLGCQFSCDFCMINIVNRTDNGEYIDASDSASMRFWSPSWVLRQLDLLADLGVRHVRISDEMFFLNRRYYKPILEEVKARQYNFNMWAYSRVDTIRSDMLDLFKEAGVNWLALGIEAGDQTVRRAASKGSFQDVNIRDICGEIRKHDLSIISNFIVGLQEDTEESVRATFDLARELNTEMMNVYPCQALPGSPLYTKAKLHGWDLPKNFAEYGFLNYEAKPLATNSLSSAEVLKLRDEGWMGHFSNDDFLRMIEIRFGIDRRRNLERLAAIKLKRKLLGE